MLSTDYRVELDIFSGPLDLLLYLVRRNEVEVLELSISLITSQFLDFLEVLELIDLDLVGDFLVVAASLTEIKSRQALPRVEVDEEDVPVEEDPRSDLVRQLLEYKKFKDAAKLLDEQAATWQERYPRLTDERPSVSGDPASDLIKEVELWDLVSALARVLRKNTTENETSIVYDDTPISVYVQRIQGLVETEGKVAFSSLFGGTNVRSKIVGIFLAVLELLRHYGLRAEQPAEYGEIWILPPLQSDSSPPESPPSE